MASEPSSGLQRGCRGCRRTRPGDTLASVGGDRGASPPSQCPSAQLAHGHTHSRRDTRRTRRRRPGRGRRARATAPPALAAAHRLDPGRRRRRWPSSCWPSPPSRAGRSRGTSTAGASQLKDRQQGPVTAAIWRGATDAFRQAESDVRAAAEHASERPRRRSCGTCRSSDATSTSWTAPRWPGVSSPRPAPTSSGARGPPPRGPGLAGARWTGRLPVEAIASLSGRRALGRRATRRSAQAAIDATPSTLLVGPVADGPRRRATAGRRGRRRRCDPPRCCSMRSPRSREPTARSGLPARGREPGRAAGHGGHLGRLRGPHRRTTATISVSPFRGVLTLPQLAPDCGPGAQPRLPPQLRRLRRRGIVPRPQHDAGLPVGGAARRWGTTGRTPARPLDGVISADPFALQQLFQVTGPATIPSLGRHDRRRVTSSTTRRTRPTSRSPAEGKASQGDPGGGRRARRSSGSSPSTDGALRDV